MKSIKLIPLLFFFVSTTISIAQPYVVNETIEKVFSEGFTDVNDHFPSTPASDPKFWGKYADGYYYMERKIGSPRAVVAKAEATSKNFSIKTKMTLGPVGGSDASVGVMFLVQSSGRGGFVFEVNKKKSFRILDLGTSAFITKEGTDGWIKSKAISPATRSNTFEIKSFRGKFDIYVNSQYVYSFVNDSYKKGTYGVYIGPGAAASLYYFNAYNLDIPGSEPEIDVAALNAEIESLKLENDSLKTVALTAKFGGNDKAAISAIKVLENQLKAINEENVQLKKILKEYEENEPAHSPEDIEKEKESSDIMVEKIGKLSAERDSVSEINNHLKNKGLQIAFQRDSLRNANVELMKKMDFLEAHIKEVQAEIDIIKAKEKTPSTPSEIAATPKLNLPETTPSAPLKTAQELPLPDTAGVTELVVNDSTYDHTIDVDTEIGLSEELENTSLLDEEDSNEPSIPELTPLRNQKIAVKKAVKSEFKDK